MATKAAKKESNNLFKLLTGIAPESALPGRSKAAIWTEVSVGPPWMEKLLAKGCPDESTTSTLSSAFWSSYGWWTLEEKESPNKDEGGFWCLGP